MEFKILDDLNKDIIAIREEAFIKGRGVPREIELDGKDSILKHFCLYHEDRLYAYLRAEAVGELLHIGRVAVAEDLRGQGYGRELLGYLLEHAKTNGFKGVELSAVNTAVGFYEKLGFVAEGDYYDEAGAPHIYMIFKFDKREKTIC